ncbi:hypothetical protein OSTOST_01347 [Ostertagia ostertagi]
MDMNISEKRVKVAIIGSGLGGLAIAAQIKSGVTTDMVVFEKGDDLGGVWRVNRYPNAACDTPVEMYAMTFFSKHNWSSNFAPWHEILDYANELAAHYDLRENIRFNSLVTSAVWLGDVNRWCITLANGDIWNAEFLIWAGGLFSQPLIPSLPGIDLFNGQIIHTANWDPDIDLSGKRVALVGSGASSIQVLPYAAQHADHVHAFIRTPSYVMPKPEESYGKKEWENFRRQPELQAEKRRNQPHVEAVAGGVTAFFEEGVIGPGGEAYAVDMVILATGFKTSKMLGELNIVGRTRQSLSAVWGDRPEAFLGMMMKGFPNFFMVCGPNATAASLSSMVEAQAEYIRQCIRKVDSMGVRSIEVRPEVQDAFNEQIERWGNASVMVKGGCESYYRAGGDGGVFTHWPNTVASYVNATREMNSADFYLGR